MKQTTDIYFAAVLLALGNKLEEVDRKDPRHMIFRFVSQIKTGGLGDLAKAGLDDIETQWANKTLMVNGWDFAEAIKRMKSVIHSGN